MKVQVYTKDRCPQCTATLRDMKKLGVHYETESALRYADFLAQLGAQAAPVVVVYDDAGRELDHWFGYRPDSIRALAEAGDAA